MAPTASKRAPRLLGQNPAYCVQSSAARSGVSATSTGPPSAIVAASRHAVDMETAVWPTPFQDVCGTGEQNTEPNVRRRPWMAVVGVGAALVVVVLVVVVLVVVFVAPGIGGNEDPGEFVGEFPTPPDWQDVRTNTTSELTTTHATETQASTTQASTTTADNVGGPSLTGTTQVASSKTTTMSSMTTSSIGDACYTFAARLSIHRQLQEFDGSPDKDVYGTAVAHLCTNGTLSASATMKGGGSQLIASHIHVSDGVDGTDGADGSGPVVIGFCGSNADPHIDMGKPYAVPCSAWDDSETSTNAEMPGVFVDRTMSVGQRVKDIRARTSMYYFSFDSAASFAHWRQQTGDHRGMARGMLELSSMPR